MREDVARRFLHAFAPPLLFERALLNQQPPAEPAQRGQWDAREHGEPDRKPERRGIARGTEHRWARNRVNYIREPASGVHHFCVTRLSGSQMSRSAAKEIRQLAEETRRHMEMIAESIRDDLRIFADAIGLYSERLNRHDARIDRLEQHSLPG